MSAREPVVRPLSWTGDARGHVHLLDQTLLPAEETWIDVASVEAMVEAIYRLAVRGAPAIGLAAAYGMQLGLTRPSLTATEPRPAADPGALLARAEAAAAALRKARPTAVNLFHMVDRLLARTKQLVAQGAEVQAVVSGTFDDARAVQTEIDEECRAMGELAADLLSDGARVLTHCNAGALATAGIGTALAPLYVGRERGLSLSVFADETRPLLQGARLTAWELGRTGIDVTVIPDGAAASVMRAGGLDIVFVGADRIARNGDVCNKIGTYAVALAAQRHGLPFYVVAPLSTFDPQAESGAQIPIEERPSEEIWRAARGDAEAAPGSSSIHTYNPAFDVTPAELVTGIVTERGVIHAPDFDKVSELLRSAGRL